MEKEELQILENSMSREDIIKYAGRIKPVMIKDGKLWWIESKKIHGESCTYDPAYLEEVKSVLVPLRTIETYHKYGGYYAFLRPSVDEAIFQCPKDILEEVIYTICLSAYDNYNVKDVVLKVNGEEIYKSIAKTIE